MKPYLERDGIRIYHGDAREVLEELEPGSVDLLLTDPPYGQQFHGQALLTEKANVRADGARQGMRLVRQVLFGLERARVLAPDAHAYLFCHWESWPDFYDAVASYLQIRNALVWWKDRGGVGDTAMDYARDYEVVLYATRAARRPLQGRRDGAVIRGIPPVGNARIHPTEKPTELLAYLVRKSAPPGGLVLDPFMGAGPTLEAARASGCRAVGIDVEERWCEAAARRLSQRPLFEVEPAPNAGEEAPCPNP